jgi:NAD(P)-dependent dehydrogenase (short-subunit alcohol dehydrogenase family)
MHDGELAEYNKPVWEPLWRVCEERRMPLVTHIGGGTTADYTGPEAVPLLQLETGGFLFRRAMPIDLVDPVDVSNAIAWLVSDDARYITGTVIPVDAGQLNKR